MSDAGTPATPLALLAPLATALRRGAQRFDALARRERLLIAGAAAALALMVADTLWLTPAFVAFKAAHAKAAALPAQRAREAAEAQREAALADGRQALLRHEISRLRGELREGEAALREAESAFVGPEQMVGLLERLLERHGSVRLREMSVLPRTDLTAEPAVAGAAPASSAAAAATPGLPRAALYRHGLELTLEGRYADLLAYLAALEALPHKLLWGGMKFRVEQHPRMVLTLRVYTLGVERHWLEI